MARPIEMVRGGDRVTVYSEAKATMLIAAGWQRVKDLPVQEQERLQGLPPIPWTQFDDMAMAAVLARAEGLAPEQVQAVIAYETATKNRAGVLNVLAKGAPAKSIPAANVEAQLEAETGHDVVKSGDNPPTYVETDKPAKDE